MSSTRRFLCAQSGSPDVAIILLKALLIVSGRRIKRALGKFFGIWASSQSWKLLRGFRRQIVAAQLGSWIKDKPSGSYAIPIPRSVALLNSWWRVIILAPLYKRSTVNFKKLLISKNFYWNNFCLYCLGNVRPWFVMLSYNLPNFKQVTWY